MLLTGTLEWNFIALNSAELCDFVVHLLHYCVMSSSILFCGILSDVEKVHSPNPKMIFGRSTF